MDVTGMFYTSWKVYPPRFNGVYMNRQFIRFSIGSVNLLAELISEGAPRLPASVLRLWLGSRYVRSLQGLKADSRFAVPTHGVDSLR